MRLISHFVLVLLFAALPAHAQSLDKAACEALRGEHGGLTAAGLKADMEKGAEWGKANLSEDRLKLIARLIEVEEQLAFRCRSLAIPIKRRQVLPSIDAAAAGDLDLAPAAPLSPQKSKSRKKSQTSPASAAADLGAEPPSAAVTAGPETTGSTKTPASSAQRQKPKKVVTKRKPAAAPKPEPSGLFDLNLE